MYVLITGVDTQLSAFVRKRYYVHHNVEEFI